MQKIRYGFTVLGMLLCLATSATAGVSVGIGIGLPNVSIGINVPVYPELVPVPGYPVYYAPGMDSNYFFYDGMYWVYQNDNWYASSWYNGPWAYVDPGVVPLYILRVPVGYYRQPPVYFRSWQSNRPPRWGEHWGHSWEQRRGGWDRWNRSAAPRPAPLPVYQRQYQGSRYPRAEQQPAIRGQQYRYQPRDKVVREHWKQVEQKSPAANRGKQERPQQTRTPQQDQRQQPQHREQRQQPAAQQQQQQKQQPAQQQRERQQHQQPAQQQHQQPAQQQHQQPAQQQHQQPAQQQRQQPAQQQQQHQQPAQQQQHQQPAAQHQQQREQQGEQRGGGQERGQGNREEGRGR